MQIEMMTLQMTSFESRVEFKVTKLKNVPKIFYCQRKKSTSLSHSPWFFCDFSDQGSSNNF